MSAPVEFLKLDHAISVFVKKLFYNNLLQVEMKYLLKADQARAAPHSPYCFKTGIPNEEGPMAWGITTDL